MHLSQKEPPAGHIARVDSKSICVVKRGRVLTIGQHPHRTRYFYSACRSRSFHAVMSIDCVGSNQIESEQRTVPP